MGCNEGASSAVGGCPGAGWSSRAGMQLLEPTAPASMAQEAYIPQPLQKLHCPALNNRVLAGGCLIAALTSVIALRERKGRL